MFNWITNKFSRKSPAAMAAAPAFRRRKSLDDFPHHTDTDTRESGSSDDGDDGDDDDGVEGESSEHTALPIEAVGVDLRSSLRPPSPPRKPPAPSQPHPPAPPKKKRVRIAKPPTGEGEKITYKKVRMILNEVYNTEQTISSTALDMLSVYLKGQKILYVEAKTICEIRMNFLMLPAIMISAISTVLSLTEGLGVIVASIAALNSCLLSLISYLKLDARVEAHKTSAYKFDKLQALCEFNSGKVLFFDTKKDAVIDILAKIEAQVNEIKETNQFVLPEIIRYRYPVLYSTNVFSVVKKLVNREIVLMNRLKNAINAIVIYRSRNKDLGDRMHIELDALEAEQNLALEKLIRFRDEYLDIDTLFKDEIEKHSIVRPWYRRLCDCLKN